MQSHSISSGLIAVSLFLVILYSNAYDSQVNDLFIEFVDFNEQDLDCYLFLQALQMTRLEQQSSPSP